MAPSSALAPPAANPPQRAALRRQPATGHAGRHKRACRAAEGAAANVTAAEKSHLQATAACAGPLAATGGPPATGEQHAWNRTVAVGAASTQQQQQLPGLDLTPPDAQHVMVVPNFFDGSEQLRQWYEEKMLLDPLRPKEQRARWGYNLMPRRFRLMRTPAQGFFPAPLHARLVEALQDWGARQLGCSEISPLWLSYYVEQCRQSWLCAAPHGSFAFVLSLTRWEQRCFTGGEIMLLQQPSAFETDETTLIDPAFNTLVLWDSRTPHGVCEVNGTDDPLEARVVLQGWFTQPRRLFTGSLSAAEAGPALDACAAAVQSAVRELGLPPASGTVVVRLEVEGSSGRVTRLHWLVNTLVGPPPISSKQGRSPAPWVVTEAVLQVVGECCAAARLPPSRDGGDSTITLPFVFP